MENTIKDKIKSFPIRDKLKKIKNLRSILSRKKKKETVNLKEIIRMTRSPMRESNLKTIAKALQISPGQTDITIRSSLESLNKENSGRISKGNEPRFELSSVWLSRAEKSYRLDPFFFGAVNKISRLITSPKLLLMGGNDETKKIMHKVMRKLHLRRILKVAVKDVMIYGFGFIEIVKKGEMISKLVVVDPKTIDYQRDGAMKIALDDDGEIVGYVWKREGDERDIPRENGILIRFFSVGEQCLGISPLEPCFKISWIRLNLEDALGENVYRHGYPTYYFKIGTEEMAVTPALVNQASEILKGWETASEIILPYWIEPGVMGQKATITQIAGLLEYFSNQIPAGLEIPKSLLQGDSTGGKGAVGEQNLDFEKTILCYQEDVIDQVVEQLFEQTTEYRAMEDPPRLSYQEITPDHKLFRVRNLTRYADKGLLTRTEDLENQIRLEENLPPLPKDRPKGCVFGLTEKCSIREDSYVSMKDLSSFCNICAMRTKSTEPVVEETSSEGLNI